MNFDNVIKERHSCRSFKPRTVPWSQVVLAIDSALQGPFAGNIQNIKFVVVDEDELIERLSSYSEQVWISQASSVIIVCSKQSEIEPLYNERAQIYTDQQTGAAINTIMLKLTDLNIGSCWVSSFDEKKIKKLLKIPNEVKVQALIPLGYEDEKQQKQQKKSPQSKTFWNGWDKSTKK